MIKVAKFLLSFSFHHSFIVTRLDIAVTTNGTQTLSQIHVITHNILCTYLVNIMCNVYHSARM